MGPPPGTGTTNVDVTSAERRGSSTGESTGLSILGQTDDGRDSQQESLVSRRLSTRWIISSEETGGQKSHE